MRAFSLEALMFLAEQLTEPLLGPSYYWTWSRTGDEIFAVEESEAWLWPQDQPLTQLLLELPSSKHLIESIEVNPVTVGQLGEVVGTAAFRHRLEAESILISSLLWPHVLATRSFAFDSATFESAATTLYEGLAATSIDVSVLATVRGVDGLDTTLDLGNDVVFRRMTDEEIGALLRFGHALDPEGAFGFLDPSSRMVRRSSQFCVTSTLHL